MTFLKWNGKQFVEVNTFVCARCGFKTGSARDVQEKGWRRLLGSMDDCFLCPNCTKRALEKPDSAWKKCDQCGVISIATDRIRYDDKWWCLKCWALEKPDQRAEAVTKAMSWEGADEKPAPSYVGPGDVIYSPVTGEPCRVTKVSGSVRMLEKPFPHVGGSECICANCSAHRILGLIEPITGPLGRK